MLEKVNQAKRWFQVLGGLSAASAALLPLGSSAREKRLALQHRWGRWACDRFGIQLKVEDENPPSLYEERGCVFVILNQTSLIEALIIPQLVPSPAGRVLVNWEFALLPGLGWFSLASRHLILIRQWPAQSKRQIARAGELLRGGEHFMISIEGRRSATGLGPYKRGAVVLALSAQAPIVPVFFRGMSDRLPMGHWQVRPGKVQATIGKAIPTVGRSYQDRFELTAMLREIAVGQS